MSDDEKECCSDNKWWAIMWMVIALSASTCTAITEVAKYDGFRTEAIEETS